jgi:hypothetical protein
MQVMEAVARVWFSLKQLMLFHCATLDYLESCLGERSRLYFALELYAHRMKCVGYLLN